MNITDEMKAIAKEPQKRPRKKASAKKADPKFAQMGFYKTKPHAEKPFLGSDHAACFDVKACFTEYEQVTYYNAKNQKLVRNVRRQNDELGILIDPGDRILVPTGLIFDIPKGYSVRLHPRSGMTLKNGLVLANGEGVIDSDYISETFVILTNMSTVRQFVEHGHRIAQCELVKDLEVSMHELANPPGKKSNREGGFGSTGTK